MAKRESFKLGGVEVAAGERKNIDLNAGALYTHEPVYMPVQVIHGRRSGPVLFVTAAIHGDELNGIEIVRRLLAAAPLRRLSGTLIAVPIVNALGVMHLSRYLPDRRDLNRSFPGSKRGSLAARLAHLLMTEIVARADYGIDLHTGALHRSNLPQIRAALDNPEVQALADAFAAPVNVNSALRDGSMRDAAGTHGIPMLLYEAGEALRFDEFCIRVGVRGVLNVMRKLEMLPRRKAAAKKPHKSYVARSSSWVRAPCSGIFRASAKLGDLVKAGGSLGVMSDAFGEGAMPVTSPTEGIIIGCSNLPLFHEGDAMFHVGEFERPKLAAEHAAAVQLDIEDDPLPTTEVQG